MIPDFTDFFNKYEALVEQVDEAFQRMQDKYPDSVKCRIGCSDCCYALFDLTLIEALYINYHFNRLFDGDYKEQLLEKANRSDRQVNVIKRSAFKASQNGENPDAILGKIAQERVQCPLLNDKSMCDLYEYRPITCRVYGLPTSINSIGHTCGHSGFEKGQAYPTVKLDKILNNLYTISKDLVSSLETKYPTLDQIVIPVSMAMLIEVNEEFLGTSDATSGKTKEDSTQETQ